MATDIIYGGFTFPSPTPFAGISEAPVFISGGYDHSLNSIDLVGQITGCNLTSLKIQKDTMVEALSSGFQTLTIGNTGYSYAKPLSIDFSSSSINKVLPYSIKFETFQEKGFSSFYGVSEPSDVWDFGEQEKRVVSVSHTVSAKGEKTSATDSLTVARNFVNSRLNGFNHDVSLFFSGQTAILKSKQETVNRVNNSYSVTEQYDLSNNLSSYDISGCIVRADCKISYSADSSLSLNVNGTIEGGISGLADTGYFTKDQATDFAKQSVVLSKIQYEEVLYGDVLREPQTYNYNVDTGSNSISFSFAFADPTDPRTGDVINDYSSSIDANKDSYLVNVSLKGELKYNTTNDIFLTDSPETEDRYKKVEAELSGVNFFALAQQSFNWFNEANLVYSQLPLNDVEQQLTVNKKPFQAAIDYQYSYSNTKDIFSGLFRNPTATIETDHPILKHGITQTTDKSFAVQELYDTLKRVNVTMNGDLASGVTMATAIDYVSGWMNQYSTQEGTITQDSIQTGNGKLSMTKSYVVK